MSARETGPISWRVWHIPPGFLSATVGAGGVRRAAVLDVDVKDTAREVIRLRGTPKPGGFWLERYGFLYPDPGASLVALWDARPNPEGNIASRVGAISAVLLGSPENGILAGDYNLMGNDSCPVADSDIIGDACVMEGRLWLGPGRDHLEGRSPYDQTFWKGVVLHEAGHLVQSKASGIVGFSSMYTFTTAGLPDSSTDLSVVHADPPGTPSLCACDQVEGSNKLHCMQSIERYGEAQSEGFAHFYAARTLNQGNQTDCIFPYYKETVLETCESGVCSAWPGSLHNNLPPVPFDCVQPAQWRNNLCPASGSRPNQDRATEVDWMKFLYALNTQAENKWAMTDLWRLYAAVDAHRAGCAGHESGILCWRSFDAAGAATATTEEQALEVRDGGLAYGIDENLSVDGGP